MPMLRRARMWLAAAIVVAVAALLGFAAQSMRAPSTDATTRQPAPEGDASAPTVRPPSEPATSPSIAPPPTDRAQARARRDALRERIVARQRLAERRAVERDAEEQSHRASRHAAAAADDGGAEPTGPINRMGPEHQAMVEAVRADLMPVVEECIAAAVEENAEMAGTLAIGITAVGDDEIGAVIDAVDFPPEGDLTDPTMLECIREGALTMALPPPPEGGNAEFMMTLRVGE